MAPMLLKIGYVATKDKFESPYFQNLIGYKYDDEVEIQLIQLDPLIPVEKQEKCSCVIHKINDYFTKDLRMTDEKEISDKISAFSDDLALHDIPMIDPWESVAKISDRSVISEIIRLCEFEMDGIHVLAPPFVKVDSDMSDEEIGQKMRAAGLGFPLIAKPPGGICPRLRYEMSLHFAEKVDDCCSLKEQLKDNLPCFLQQYYNHGGMLYKLYVVGDSWHVTPRPSIIDLDLNQTKPIYFRSNYISKKLGSISITSSPDYNAVPKDCSAGLNKQVINELIRRLRTHIQFDLVGLDIIYCRDSRIYYVVDVNYFPGFKDFSDLTHKFVLLLKKYIKL